MHRFLISSPDLRIDARFTPETSFCVHRFLISGSYLGINAAEKSSACSGRSGNEVRVRFYSSLPRRRMVPPAVFVAATMSASDSNFRCRKGEWFRLQRPWRLRCPHPILIFVAAKRNGSACSGRSSDEVRLRFYSSLPRRRMARLQQSSRQRPSASDSNLRCHKKE